MINALLNVNKCASLNYYSIFLLVINLTVQWQCNSSEWRIHILHCNFFNILRYRFQFFVAFFELYLKIVWSILKRHHLNVDDTCHFSFNANKLLIISTWSDINLYQKRVYYLLLNGQFAIVKTWKSSLLRKDPGFVGVTAQFAAILSPLWYFRNKAKFDKFIGNWYTVFHFCKDMARTWEGRQQK